VRDETPAPEDPRDATVGADVVTERQAQAPRVDFYVLDAAGAGAVERYACRLAEKAWRSGHAVWVHTESRAAARAVDEALWTFRDDSFVPHAVAGPDAYDTPIVIGDGRAPATAPEVLINLGATVPDFAGSCGRIAEIVGADQSSREAGRARFRIYRDLGCEPAHHRIEGPR